MKNFIQLITVAFSLLITTNAFAQGYTTNKATPAQEKKADDIVLKFDDVLSLTEKQELLFKNKQAEFVYANEAVLNSERSKKEINGILLALYQEQANEMKEILTPPQFDLYVQYRSKYDPLFVILK
ncbi:hypothetical protein [Nonlabens sp.]|uniref:hypothetical protein n=1 Tax=Nonlabens sp. TaxID=1888209 RepID=UPI003F69D339